MPEEIKELLQEYKNNQDALYKEVSSVNEEIARLQSYRNSLTEPYQSILEGLEFRIKSIMLEAKQSYECEIGKVTYRKGGVRRSWDLDALDSVCKFDPHIKELIWGHRGETPFAPSISIKLD